MITLTFTDQERDFLEKLLRTKYSEQRRGLQNTAIVDNKQALTQQLEQIENILFMLTHSLRKAQ